MGIRLQCLYSHIADVHCGPIQFSVALALLGFCLATLIMMQDWCDVERCAVEASQLSEFEICYLDDSKGLVLNSWQQTKV